MAPDWSAGLPSDLLAVIFSRLLVSDFIRSGGVCRSWRRVTAEKYRTSPEIPYLMIPGGDDDGDSGKLFSLIEHKVYPFPQICGKRCLGSSDGWVVTIDDLAELHILNPFTGAEADLPSIAAFSFVHGVARDPDDGRITGYMLKLYGELDPPCFHDLDYARKYSYYKAIYFPSAKMAVVTVTFMQYLAFARPGDSSWTELKPRCCPCGFTDIILHNEGLYGVGCDGIVVGFNLGKADNLHSTPVATSIWRFPPIRSTNWHYLVETLDGDLLHVCRYQSHCNRRSRNRTGFDARTRLFKVFQLQLKNRIEVTTLGENTALFIGHNHSISISTLDLPLKGNCIYFTDDNIESYGNKPKARRDMGVFKFEDGSIQPLPSDFFFRHFNWPPPIWITPSFA